MSKDLKESAVTVGMTSEMYEWVTGAAEENETTRAAVVRKAIRDAMRTPPGARPSTPGLEDPLAPKEPQGPALQYFAAQPVSVPTLGTQIAEATRERDSVHLMKDLTASAQREEFERRDAEVRRLQALQASADVDEVYTGRRSPDGNQA